MKHTKNSNIKIITIFACITLVICCIAAWLITANNAFASDDNIEPTAEEQQNATVQISFDMDGVDSGVVTSFYLYDQGQPKYDYNLGDKLTVEEGLLVTYEPVIGNNAVINVKTSSGDSVFGFQIYCPLGYEFANYFPETAPTSITQDTDFKVVYKKSEKPYKIMGTVQKTGPYPQQRIPGVNIQLSKSGQSTALSTTTDSDGKYILENVPVEYLDGTLFASKEGLTDYYVVLGPQDYDQNHECLESINLSDKEDAEMQLSKPNEHHKYFDLRSTRILKPDTILADSTVSNESFFLDMEVPLAGDWVIGSDGSVTYKLEAGEMIMQVQIIPHGEEGYALSEWLQYKDNNEVLHFKPGETITIGNNEPLKIEPVYAGSTPQPTPSEDINSTAQTGDTNNAVVPLAIIAAVCAITLIARRRLNQK